MTDHKVVFRIERVPGGLHLEPCGSCQAPMFWAISERGRPIPMDPLPLLAGNMALRWDLGGLLARVVPEAERPLYDGPLYQTHFMTCPFAGHHRSNRKREPQ